MDKELINFSEQIKKGNIEVIDKDKLIIENYPLGFNNKCIMTFEKAQNRNGQIIKRYSNINGKISKPKKTTANRLNIFVYDKELKKHFIVSVSGTDFSLYASNLLNANATYQKYYFSYEGTDYQHELNIKSRTEYAIIRDFLKPYLNITEEVYKKLIVLNGGV